MSRKPPKVLLPRLKDIRARDSDSDESRKNIPARDNETRKNVPRRAVKTRKRARDSQRAARAAPSLNLCQLPTEVLHKIIGNINIWHHNRIRGTSKRMRDVDDSFIMHEFKKALHQHTHLNPVSYESAALKVIQLATEVYLHSGFESTFCGCILPLLRSSYKDPFSPQIHLINKFLIHFYNTVDELMGRGTLSQRSILLYDLTLMRFFKKFDDATITSSAAMPHSRVVAVLRGPWLRMLGASKAQTLDQPEKRGNLLVILSEILVANITGKAFRRVWDCPTSIYAFGNDTSRGDRVPETCFTFTVHGSRRMRSLFHSCLEDPEDELKWPSEWPKDKFTVKLDIECRQGSTKSQHKEFGSLVGNE